VLISTTLKMLTPATTGEIDAGPSGKAFSSAKNSPTDEQETERAGAIDRISRRTARSHR